MRRLPLYVAAPASAPPRPAPRPQRVVLLGPIQQEPLALQYLAAAVRQAGHEAHVVPCANRAGLEEALCTTLRLEPDLVGLGIAFQNHIDEYLLFSFSRQLHEVYFPGVATERLAARVRKLCVEARGDTVLAIREAAMFVAQADVFDSKVVQRFAVSQALRINAADAERRRQVEELWQHLQVRGLELMKGRGVRSFPRVQADFGIAAGS